MKYYLHLVFAILLFPLLSHAADPSVQYFTPSSSSIKSNQPLTFTWGVQNAGGYSFSILCNQGVKLFNTDGSVYPCDTTTSSTLSASGSLNLSVRNLSGGSKTLTARLTPKDAVGVDFLSARTDTSVVVLPLENPIETVTGTTTITSLVPYTLGWDAPLVTGVNLIISCSSIIRTTSPAYSNGYLPCGTPIFSSDLSPSSSLGLLFENGTTATSSLSLILIPAMEPSVYNGAGSRTITVDVVPYTIPNPQVELFTSKPTETRIVSGSPIDFLWNISRSDGANLWFSCNANITALVTIGGATSTPPCNTLAFANTLEASSSAQVVFTNKGVTSEPISVSLIPKSKKGGFDATQGKQLAFSILAPGATIPVVTTPIKATVITTTPGTTTTKTVRFTKYLYRGLTHPEVSLLQEYLRKDSTLYPEGIVSGYFGPATERAVKRLQEKYGLGTSVTPGFGGVGPKTRALLNSLNQ